MACVLSRFSFATAAEKHLKQRNTVLSLRKFTRAYLFQIALEIM